MNNFFKRFNLVDWLNYIYFTIISILIIVFHNRVPYWYYLIFFNIVYLIFIAVLVKYVKKDSSKVLIFLRYFYQVIFVTFIYKETEFLMRIFHSNWLDPVVTQMEFAIFGVHPTIWLQKFINPVLTEYMKFVYFAYFVLVPFMPLYLFFTKKYKAFYHYLFVLTLALYMCYIGFIIFPVQGPRYYWSDFVFPGRDYLFPFLRNPLGYIYEVYHLKGYLFTYIVDHIMSGADSTGACIPSAHNAASIVILFMIKKYIKKLYPYALPIIISIFISTVYNRYHYVTDMVTGILTGLLALYIGNKIFSKKKIFIID